MWRHAKSLSWQHMQCDRCVFLCLRGMWNNPNARTLLGCCGWDKVTVVEVGGGWSPPHLSVSCLCGFQWWRPRVSEDMWSRACPRSPQSKPSMGICASRLRLKDGMHALIQSMIFFYTFKKMFPPNSAQADDRLLHFPKCYWSFIIFVK